MTTPTPTIDAAQMPPLPVVAYLRTAETMGSPVVSKEFVDKFPEHKFEFDEPLCKVSDAQAYAAQPVDRNFCERCGQRLSDSEYIHTCTPPHDSDVVQVAFFVPSLLQRDCQHCNGQGTANTGIDELPLDVCNKCNGIGLAAAPTTTEGR